MAYYRDANYKDFAIHLMNRIDERSLPYPKVSINKTKLSMSDNYVASKWVDWRKRKKVVLKDLMHINPNLGFLNTYRDVNNSI